LLLDVFGVEGCPDYPNPCTCQNKWVEPAFQMFTERKIAKLPVNEDWKLNQHEIVDWVFDFTAGVLEFSEPVPAVIPDSVIEGLEFSSNV
jgi:hypothetical protein